MIRLYLAVGLAIVFVLVLLHATLGTTPTPLGSTAEERLAAQRECERAVRASVPGARFPSASNAEDLGADRLRLYGSVDAGTGPQAVRRNYECFLRPDATAGAFVTDSVRVWQSH